MIFHPPLPDRRRVHSFTSLLMLYPVCRLRSSSPNYCTRSTTWSRYDASVNVFERGYACGCLFDVHMGQNVWCPRGICTHVCLCQRRVDYSSPVCDVMRCPCYVVSPLHAWHARIHALCMCNHVCRWCEMGSSKSKKRSHVKKRYSHHSCYILH